MKLTACIRVILTVGRRPKLCVIQAVVSTRTGFLHSVSNSLLELNFTLPQCKPAFNWEYNNLYLFAQCNVKEDLCEKGSANVHPN